MHYINPDYIAFYIASGSTTANWVCTSGRQLAAVILNSGLSGTQMYYDVATEEGNAMILYSGGAPYSSVVTAGWNLLNTDIFRSVNFVRFRMSATAQTGIQHGSAVVRPI